MTDRRCGTCHHYRPARNPDTGRVLPSKAGSCGYEVKWPELPICYWGANWPDKVFVWPGLDATKCAMWEKR